MPLLLKETFKAWIDRMPPGGPKLIVVGEVQVPTGGWHAGLTRRSPQGINPDILILDVSAQAPSGMVTQVITTIPLRYEERPPVHQYTQVTIVDGHDQVTVDVEITH
jgi:hypothetical protein